MASSVAAACASTTPGAKPNDMSVGGHDAEARRHSEEAEAHASKFDPKSAERLERCRGGKAQSPADHCWSSVTNPTATHLERAKRHRGMAADHRDGSGVLTAAEASACGGLDDEDRDASPFEHREDIVASEALQSSATGGKGTTARLLGASVTLRAVPGLTKEYLQRLVNCHSARNASMGFAMPEMAVCPLSVNGAKATVESSGPNFRIEIRADDTQAANEILRRAKALSQEK